MAKAKKQRSKQYDPKLAIKGSFADVIKVSVTPTKKDQQEKPKEAKKK